MMVKPIYVILLILLSACVPTPLEIGTLTQTLSVPSSLPPEPKLTKTPLPTTAIPLSQISTITNTPTSTQYATHTHTPTLGIGSNRTSQTDGMTMVFIPEGEFIMGSENFLDAPVHLVYLDAFWMDKTEVTNSMFAKFMEETGFKVEIDREQFETDRLANHPATFVSWKDASAYCKWAGRRLPSEAEWEKAARGTDQRVYPWGNEFDRSKVNIGGDGDQFEKTAPVGSFPGDVSPFGVLDMAGNVGEYVFDWYSSIYYEESPTINPTGPLIGNRRVVRGNFWLDAGSELSETSSRGSVGSENSSSDYLGFRCAVSE